MKAGERRQENMSNTARRMLGSKEGPDQREYKEVNSSSGEVWSTRKEKIPDRTAVKNGIRCLVMP